jgi:hypothetical protein
MGKYKTSLKRQNAFFLNFDGQKLANAIEKAGGNIKPALERATKKSLPVVHKDFDDFASKHEYSGDMHESLIEPSETEFIWGKKAMTKMKGFNKSGKKGFAGAKAVVIGEEDCLYYEFGFKAKDGGMPALYLDLGTPKRTPTKGPKYRGQIKPTYFIYYAVENNMKKIHNIQMNELTKILEDLKK